MASTIEKLVKYKKILGRKLFTITIIDFLFIRQELYNFLFGLFRRVQLQSNYYFHQELNSLRSSVKVGLLESLS